MAWIPSTYSACVVAIGTIIDDERRWIGSGFFYGDLVSLEPERLYQTFLVTNRHVLKDLLVISLMFNPQDGAHAREVDLSGGARIVDTR